MNEDILISANIFNTEKDYNPSNNRSLFLGEKKGLIDTIHKSNEEIWDLYKLMKSLDWDENEFDYSSCMIDFKTCSKSTYDLMIKTLAWQWEADSIASHSLIPIVAPFVTDTTLWSAWSAVALNENLHGLTYSEIVRGSFENPNDVLQSVLSEVKAYQRLQTVAAIFTIVYNVSHRLSLGMIDKDSDEAYDAIFLFTVTMLILERIQFGSSFLITFAIADTGQFSPIGKAVQKICTDELEVHVKINKAVIKNELNTKRGFSSYLRNKELIKKVIDEVVTSELNWNKYLFSEDRELPGLLVDTADKWAIYSATDIYNFLRIDNKFGNIEKNPSPFMEDWIKINKNQASPQEEKSGNYLLGGFTDNSVGKIYEFE